MADQKISALTELTTPAAADELVVVDKSDTSMAASGTDKRIKYENLTASAPQSALEVYVDPVNGDNGNDGLSWQRAYETIQAAYDALVTASAGYSLVSGSWRGAGRIYLAPGDHQVGEGVNIDGFYPVEIYGTRSGLGGHSMSTSASRIVTSSDTADYMVRIWHDDAISRGCRFRDVSFRPDTAVNTSLTKCIYAISTDYLDVQTCSFDVADQTTSTTICCIFHENDPGAGDDMAARIIDNWSARMQFYKANASGGTGGNFNRIVIEKNKINYGHATVAAIELAGAFISGSISFNQMEGVACMIRVNSTEADGNLFIGNGGESPSPLNPYIDFATGFITNSVVIASQVTQVEAAKTVTNATNASPIVITSTAHGTVTGDQVYVASVGGNTAANGYWTVTVTDANTFSLNGSTGNGAYTSGGTAKVVGIYCRFGANTSANIYLGGGNSGVGYKHRVVDLSTQGGNRIISGNLGLPVKYKSGPGATISDADFTAGGYTWRVPLDGVSAVARDSTTGRYSLWFRANDAWTRLDPVQVTTKGDLLTFDTVPTRLGVGTNGQVLTADSAQATGVKWAPGGGVATDAIWDTKGDLAVATAADTASKLAAGTNGHVLTADSAQSTGVKWAAIAAVAPPPTPYPLPTGAIAESAPRVMVQGTSALGNGTLRLVAIVLPEDAVINAVNFTTSVSGALTQGATSNHLWGALYALDLTLLRQSANDTSPVWANGTAKAFTLSSSYTIPTTGVYYIGAMAALNGGGAVMPTLAAVTGSNAVAQGLAPVMGGASTASLSTTAPNPCAAPAIGTQPYGWVT